MNKDKMQINGTDLNKVSGKLANPIYKEYWNEERGALINPDTKEKFEDDAEAWGYLRTHKPGQFTP